MGNITLLQGNVDKELGAIRSSNGKHTSAIWCTNVTTSSPSIGSHPSTTSLSYWPIFFQMYPVVCEIIQFYVLNVGLYNITLNQIISREYVNSKLGKIMGLSSVMFSLV